MSIDTIRQKLAAAQKVAQSASQKNYAAAIAKVAAAEAELAEAIASADIILSAEGRNYDKFTAVISLADPLAPLRQMAVARIRAGWSKGWNTLCQRDSVVATLPDGKKIFRSELERLDAESFALHPDIEHVYSFPGGKSGYGQGIGWYDHRIPAEEHPAKKFSHAVHYREYGGFYGGVEETIYFVATPAQIADDDLLCRAKKFI